MKKAISILFTAILFSIASAAQANVGDSGLVRTYRIAVFAPLYLDSVFTGFKYNYNRTVPKFVLPGLDFVNGAHIAFDTLPKDNFRIEAFVYDTKSVSSPIKWLLDNKKFDSIDLMIGAVKDADFKQIADVASKKKIPFVSASYPNDGGITKNPYLFIVNSTLKAHVEGIYAYMVQNYGTNKILLCRKRGSQEDKIATYLRLANDVDGKPLLNIQTLFFDSVITPGLLKNRIDTTKETIIIGGSLDEYFAKTLATATYTLNKTYPMVLIGMPNWDGFSFFTKKDAFKDFPIHFTSPYYNSKNDRYSNMLISEYNKRYKGKPSDMAYKGFESVYLFTKILIKDPENFRNNINDKFYKVINDFNFKPVITKGEKVDYYENKHLYIMKLVNGSLLRAW